MNDKTTTGEAAHARAQQETEEGARHTLEKLASEAAENPSPAGGDDAGQAEGAGGVGDAAHRDAQNGKAGNGNNRRRSRLTFLFDRFATNVARATGSPLAFGCAVLIIVLWAAAGPWAGFSEVWQLVVNTGTTIITFLMVFLIQQNQNKDSRALHVKLDELLLALKGASEKLVDIEDLDEDELNAIAERYRRVAQAGRSAESSD